MHVPICCAAEPLWLGFGVQRELELKLRLEALHSLSDKSIPSRQPSPPDSLPLGSSAHVGSNRVITAGKRGRYNPTFCFCTLLRTDCMCNSIPKGITRPKEPCGAASPKETCSQSPEHQERDHCGTLV